MESDDYIPLSKLNIHGLMWLEKYCERYIEAIDYGERDLEEAKQHVFEAAMKYIFGDDIFKWINERLE